MEAEEFCLVLYSLREGGQTRWRSEPVGATRVGVGMGWRVGWCGWRPRYGVGMRTLSVKDAFGSSQRKDQGIKGSRTLPRDRRRLESIVEFFAFFALFGRWARNGAVRRSFISQASRSVLLLLSQCRFAGVAVTMMGGASVKWTHCPATRNLVTPET